MFQSTYLLGLINIVGFLISIPCAAEVAQTATQVYQLATDIVDSYKVIPGKSNQAIDIPEEQGYDTRLLRRAREIIEHPERYRSHF